MRNGLAFVMVSLGVALGMSTACFTAEEFRVGSGGAGAGTGTGAQGGGGSGSAAGGAGGVGGVGGTPCMMPSSEICGNGKDDDCDSQTTDSDPVACVLMEGASGSLVTRYHINEAISGTSPTEMLDAAPNPLALPLDYHSMGGADMNWTNAGGHVSLIWPQEGTPGIAQIAIDNAKIRTMLDTKTAATIEAVVDIGAAAPAGASPISWIGLPGQNGSLALRTPNGQAVELFLGGVQVGLSLVDFPQENRCVLHAVLDTAAVTDADRVQLFLNGERLPPEDGPSAPAQNTPIPIAAGSFYALGNLPPSSGDPSRSFAGRLYYAALYATALTAEQVKNNAIVLLNNDDASAQ